MLNSCDKEAFSILKDKWNFSLKYFDFKKVFKEKLISEVIDIDKFIKDKSLLKATYELQCKLKDMFDEKVTEDQVAIVIPVYKMQEI